MSEPVMERGARADRQAADAPAFGEYSPVIPRIVWGAGYASRLADEVERLGAKRALIVCSRSVGASAWFTQLHDGLASHCAGTFSEARAHTPIETLAACVDAFRRSSADCMIMIGGGSVQDTAKLAALILAEGDDLERCRVRWTSDRRLSIPALAAPKIPLIAVPTTLAAAEVVGAATYVDADKRYVVVDRGLLPRTVVYDPSIAVCTPLALFLGTGINAVAHCIEAICSVRAQPFSEALALGALTRLVSALSGCAANPGSLHFREQAQVAAGMSGIAYATTWLGIAHSLCQALGARLRAPQGALHAVMLPHAMAFNAPATRARERDMVDAIARGMPHGTVRASMNSASLTAEFIRGLGLSTSLRELGIPRDILPAVAEDAFSIWHTFFNPRKVEGPQQLLEILEAAW
jgi:maleylacetate reductase